MRIALGSFVKDIVTGFTGIAVSRIEYLTGCTQYGVLPKIGKDGKAPDCIYYDEKRLVVKGTGVVDQVAQADTGGPQHDAPTSSH